MKKQSPEIEEYLELLVRLKKEKIHAKTSLISKRLKVSPASVSEMLKKLSERGLLKLTPYKGVELTQEGEKIGTKILNKHLLLERFLVFLGINKDKAHGEACILEHALSDDVENALKKALDKGMKSGKIKKLSELKSNQLGKIVMVVGGRECCTRLSDMGLTPGAKIKLLKKSSLGPIQILLRNTKLALGRGASDKVYIEVE
ncbi:MAG: iron dependent repressor, metal binding and dimerization domain protein [Candidatus ainarchaeum sp.]|nr:iron dependent repressor, metal binding and dimerization domain protein [Candidatus ainarchaeum sp.]